jgi:hypothetical protein
MTDNLKQSQNHGFMFENSIKKNVFELPEEDNNTEIHDIPCHLNIFNNNENISIKSTCNNIIYCGDLKRFHGYDFEKTNTLVVVKYEQSVGKKTVNKILEINYNKECHNELFGSSTLEVLNEYVESVKSIPFGIVEDSIKMKYKNDKKQIQDTYNCKIQLNPKVDSNSQRRVQCSIVNFEETLDKYITYKSTEKNPNILRGKYIPLSITSSKRERNGNGRDYYINICRQNKTICKGYSKLNKDSLIKLLNTLKLI